MEEGQTKGRVATMAKKKNVLETERRVLLGFTGLTVFGALVMFVSLSTDYWVVLKIPGGEYRNASRAYVTGHHSGLWRICREEVDNKSIPVIHSKCDTLHSHLMKPVNI